MKTTRDGESSTSMVDIRSTPTPPPVTDNESKPQSGKVSLPLLAHRMAKVNSKSSVRLKVTPFLISDSISSDASGIFDSGGYAFLPTEESTVLWSNGQETMPHTSATALVEHSYLADLQGGTAAPTRTLHTIHPIPGRRHRRWVNLMGRWDLTDALVLVRNRMSHRHSLAETSSSFRRDNASHSDLGELASHRTNDYKDIALEAL